MAIYLGNTLLTGPSGGTGDAVLADDQTFTGRNTFTDTAIFSSTFPNSSLEVAERITHQGDAGTYFQFQTDSMIFFTGSAISCNMNTVATSFNTSRGNRDFIVGRQTSGEAINYDAGTDTLSSDCANFEGIAGQETGTWSPTFNRGGTITNPTATYSKVGNTVTVHYNGDVPGDGTTVNFSMFASSLPFTISNSTPQSGGTYVSCVNALITNTSDSGVVTYYSSALYFMDSNNNQVLHGDELRGYLGFTFTYTTT